MDFAKKQLEKYGWSEGKGLGKEEDGIKDALKPKIKRGTGGIGHDMAEEFTNDWWHKVYNNAANNVEVECDDTNDVNTEKRNKKNKKRKKPSVDSKDLNKPLYFTTFVKKAMLTNGITENHEEINDVGDAKESSSSDNDNDDKSKISRLTDQELFLACGGRTAHKGARHGLKSNGKLSRIEEQEKIFLERYAKLQNKSSEKGHKETAALFNELSKNKSKSDSKKEEISQPSGVDNVSNELSETSESSTKLKTKKKKKKSKR